MYTLCLFKGALSSNFDGLFGLAKKEKKLIVEKLRGGQYSL